MSEYAQAREVALLARRVAIEQGCSCADTEDFGADVKSLGTLGFDVKLTHAEGCESTAHRFAWVQLD